MSSFPLFRRDSEADSFPRQLKALAGASSYASTYSEARKAASSLDLPALLRWTDTLSDLVATVDDATATSELASPVKGPSEVEFAMLEQERDLLAAELAGLKDELAAVSSFASMCRDQR